MLHSVSDLQWQHGLRGCSQGLILLFLGHQLGMGLLGQLWGEVRCELRGDVVLAQSCGDTLVQ